MSALIFREDHMARISKEEQGIIRKRIIDVSREMFVQDGFDQTSTKSIAKKVGIAEGTLFNYFEDKTELFFEAIYTEFMENEEGHKSALVVSDNITQAIYNHMYKSIGMMFKIPRLILSEIVVATIKLAKKNTDRFKKLVELDFIYMMELSEYFDRLIKQDAMIETDTKALSEIVYSIIAYELMMYVYDKSVTHDEMNEHIKSKINILIKGYIKGELKDEH